MRFTNVPLVHVAASYGDRVTEGDNGRANIEKNVLKGIDIAVFSPSKWLGVSTTMSVDEATEIRDRLTDIINATKEAK